MIDDKPTERIRLAVTEAFSNCVLHAYEDNSDTAAGLQLIQKLADSAEVSSRPSGGTRVVMRFAMSA